MLPVLVLKLGTAALTLPDGRLNDPLLAEIARQVAELQKRYRVLLVSSGAVGSGKPFIGGYKGTVNQKKAAAAVGNPLLMASYARHLAPHGIHAAQCLLERAHFNDRARFVQLRATITELWKHGIVPVCNDNDVVNSLELRFSDNDELATLLAVAFEAQWLLIGSSVDGLLTASGEAIPYVERIDESILAHVRPEKSAQGLGGMFSKLSHTRLATSLGIATVIFNARRPGAILAAEAGTNGTRFAAQRSTLNARQRWLLSGHPHSAVIVDEGAAEALRNRKSLLSVGVTGVQGSFLAGELIEIRDASDNLVALARARTGSASLTPRQGRVVVAHANDVGIV